jgi:hypothetical protein
MTAVVRRPHSFVLRPNPRAYGVVSVGLTLEDRTRSRRGRQAELLDIRPARLSSPNAGAKRPAAAVSGRVSATLTLLPARDRGPRCTAGKICPASGTFSLASDALPLRQEVLPAEEAVASSPDRRIGVRGPGMIAPAQGSWVRKSNRLTVSRGLPRLDLRMEMKLIRCGPPEPWHVSCLLWRAVSMLRLNGGIPPATRRNGGGAQQHVAWATPAK